MFLSLRPSLSVSRLAVVRRAYSSPASKKQINDGLVPLPHKEVIDMAFDLHLPERSVIGKLPYHSPEPIIFFHGLLGSKRNYKHDCKKLATALQTPVYTVDVRNHGSSEHALPFNYGTLVNDLVHFIHQHKLGKVNIIGYSLGAKVGMLACLKHPELFSAACIIDNAPEPQPHIKAFLSTLIKSCVKLLDQGKVRVDDKLWRHKASESLKRYLPNAGVRNYVLNNIIHNPRVVEYRSPVINYDDGLIHFKNPVRHMLDCGVKDVADWPTEEVKDKKFLGPVNFIRATKSAFINPDSLKAINSFFPYNNIHEINATHFVLNERPQEYLRAVIDFFKVTRYQLENKRNKDSNNYIQTQNSISNSETMGQSL
ncbi:hypothetical protein KDRO_E00520 [Kluyveromyces lactis]|nr:hypothetical protein KDRO_E00520 [Kluyveromyces lactis]